MRKSFFLPFACALLVCVCLSCHHRHENKSITISESGDSYKMKAAFHHNKMARINKCMYQRLGSAGVIKFSGRQIDNNIILSDNTKFYIKESSGYIEIIFDKENNSPEAYKRIRNLCEELKLVIEKD